MTLLQLATRVEEASGPDRALNREVALAVGWCRQTPSEAGRRHPAWFHPDDCRHGQPVLDSLHGTDVWREPLDYLGSLDAAKSLWPGEVPHLIPSNPRIATAAALRALASQEKIDG